MVSTVTIVGGIREGCKIRIAPQIEHTFKKDGCLTRDQLDTMHSNGYFRKAFKKNLRNRIKPKEEIQVTVNTL